MGLCFVSVISSRVGGGLKVLLYNSITDSACVWPGVKDPLQCRHTEGATSPHIPHIPHFY